MSAAGPILSVCDLNVRITGRHGVSGGRRGVA